MTAASNKRLPPLELPVDLIIFLATSESLHFLQNWHYYDAHTNPYGSESVLVRIQARAPVFGSAVRSWNDACRSHLPLLYNFSSFATAKVFPSWMPLDISEPAVPAFVNHLVEKLKTSW